MTELPPLVTIIILVYNGQDYLPACLESIARLTYPNFETIAVDNASTDGSVALIRQYYPHIQLIQNPRNLGFGGGNNVGLKAAQGDVMVLLNQDTVVDTRWLTELVNTIQNDPTIGIAGCKIYNADGQTLQHAGAYLLPNALSGHVGRDEPDHGQYDQLHDVEYVTGAALAVTRQVIDYCGLLDPGYYPAYYEEADLCFSARRMGFRVIYVPSATVVHHETVSSGGISSAYLYRYHKNRLRFVIKNFNWPDLKQKFAKFELDWLRYHKPPGNNLPLLKAYLYNLFTLPATLTARRRYQPTGQPISGSKRALSPNNNRVEIPSSAPKLSSLAPTAPQLLKREINTMISDRNQKRILILGGCPLPFENQLKTYSVGLRTWQLTEPLLKDGHEVCLVASRLLYQYPAGTKPVEKTVNSNFTYYSVDNALFEGTDFVQTIHNEIQPDCIVAANSFPSYIAAGLHTECPLWADLNGHLMTEAQSAAHAFDDDHYLDHFLAYEKRVVQRADIFSTSGQPQRYATLGELGLLKRLNKKTAGYTFVHTIPNAVDPVVYHPTKPVIRGYKATDTDFVVLWSGGYNTWADIDTLFTGLEMAMAHHPSIIFVSTGGAIKGHDEVTYPQFQSRVKNSPYRHRFHLCDWVPREDVPNYFLEADVGVNVDKDTLEGVLGTRTRIYDWTKAALPTLTTNICELTQIMTREKICYTIPLNDPDALCERLLYLADHRDELKACGQRARDYFFSQLTFEQTTMPLRQWVQQPHHAPDWRPTPLKPELAPVDLSHQELLGRLQEQERLTHHLYEQVTTLNQALNDIRATRWWKLATAYWSVGAWSKENFKRSNKR
ncbi:MAG: glycosyltransferase [Anaerolineae bacterium]|nr:glycosyltransferase [Anaerolineae bacterium]